MGQTMKKRKASEHAQDEQSRKRPKLDLLGMYDRLLPNWATGLRKWIPAASSFDMPVGTRSGVLLMKFDNEGGNFRTDELPKCPFLNDPTENYTYNQMAYRTSETVNFVLAPSASFFYGRQYLHLVLEALRVLPTVLENLIIEYAGASHFLIVCNFARKNLGGVVVPDNFFIDEYTSYEGYEALTAFLAKFNSVGYGDTWTVATCVKWTEWKIEDAGV